MSSMPVCEVRVATLSDAPTLAAIHASAARAAYEGRVPEASLAALGQPDRVVHWRDAVNYGEPQVQVATLEGKAVGFVGFDRSRDKGTKPTVGEIWSLYVLPEHWGQGVGVALWDAARDGLLEEGCTQVTSWLPLAGERALRFMELAGFRRDMASARTVAVAGGRIDQLRMKRPLS